MLQGLPRTSSQQVAAAVGSRLATLLAAGSLQCHPVAQLLLLLCLCGLAVDAVGGGVAGQQEEEGDGTGHLARPEVLERGGGALAALSGAGGGLLPLLG